MEVDGSIAYFSMEIALEEGMPTYSGGLGVLAGDTIRSAANLKVPMVAVTLLHRKGYFYQKLDKKGWQTEEPVDWNIEDYVEELSQKVSVTIENREVFIRAWKYNVKGPDGFTVPVYLLDTDLHDNTEWDRTLTHYLYGGDDHYRLCQEIILGMGGVRILRDTGYDKLDRFHMNEGHASFLTLELINEELKSTESDVITEDVLDKVKKKCVFTTHTPVPAGHDKFPMDMVNKVLGHHKIFDVKEHICSDNTLNMTQLALNLSHYVNGVAKKHQEVSQEMFNHYMIDSITNGVNALRWISESFKELFDTYIPGWGEDNFSLRYTLSIPNDEVWNAHLTAKNKLIEYVNQKTNADVEPDILTIGFARRVATYKRADLIFQDIEKLKEIASKAGPFQLIFSGKAHPQDQAGKEMIQHIYKARESLKDIIKIIYLPNYNISLGKLLTSGVDVWLNTPIPPLEASGTSGMKAALNGIPSLSILDGWWIEGCIEGVTGWAIGEDKHGVKRDDNRKQDAESLYTKLEKTIIPMYYNERDKFINIMCHTIALNGSFFNTQRMMHQYVLKAYYL